MVELALHSLKLLRQVLTLIVRLGRLERIFFLTHHFQYRANHHIQEHEGGEKYERQVLNPTQRMHRHGGVHNVSPVLKGRHPEQGEHGDSNIAPERLVDGRE